MTLLILELPAVVAGRALPYLLAQEHTRREPAHTTAPPHRPGVEAAGQMQRMLHLLDRMREVYFDEPMVAMIAIGSLKDDVKREPKAIAADFEAQLTKIKTLGLRNAIRMTLKDLYKAQGQDEKVLAHLRAMLAENDAALVKARDDDDDDDDDKHDD